MNRIAAFVSDNARLAWTLALVAICAIAALVGALVRDLGERERYSLLQTEAARSGVEIMSQTLNGNVMGSLSLLGMVDEDIKRDARGVATPNSPRLETLLAAISQSYEADGVFVVGEDGLIKSSWNRGSKPSTGLDVGFRPYYQMAKQGRENVYAAVSLARGDRALYFATPIMAGNGRSGAAIGAVVARTGLARVDSALTGKSDIALLLSPQGVVFASSRAEWVGFLAGSPTPERLKAIRDLKQFGAMFEKAEPSILPFDVADGLGRVEGRRFALASAKVRWNDPYGDWSLVLMEDLSRSGADADMVRAALATALLLLLVGGLALKMLHAHHAQILAGRQVADYAQAQAASADRKSKRAEAGMRFQRAKSPQELAEAFLAEAHRIFGALQGLVYASEASESGDLRLLAGYAQAMDTPAVLALGEGLLGQCALDRAARVLDVSEDGIWTIRSGLGDARPTAVMISPLVLDDAVLGVVEIAVLEAPDQNVRDQFNELAALLALNLEILRRHFGGRISASEVPS